VFRTQLDKGTTPLLILSVLRDGELCGYEIAQRIRDLSGDDLAPGAGSL
jgi:DNA-binding PadR family transcriptional regulator